MSFVTAIRDYVETLNTISESLNQNFTISSFFSETSFYILKTIKTGLFYLLSFQWLRDFTLLPIVLPQLSAAVFKENFVLETPSKIFFDFLEIPDLHQNKFLLGFFNSFFLSLPFSIVHIVTIRRLLIQGIPAAVWSIGGYTIGQILFLSCTIFGVRSILIPWLTLEPLNYIIGIILIFRIIYSMVGENLVEIKGWSFASSPQYKTFFLTSFLLAWCEQSSIFQYLGNLTLSSNVTVLETFSTTSPISSLFTHLFYILGIFFGSIVFLSFWGFVFLQLKNLIILYTPIFITSFIQAINKTTFVLVLAFSLSSIPFYGFDYLLTGPLGFVSQDSVFKNTIFDQTRVKDYEGVGLYSSPESNYKFLDIDVAPFDRGDYLTTPDVSQALSFEDLNYRGEFDWITRQDKMSNITDSRSGFFTLSKVFKKRQKPESEVQKTEFEKTDLNRLISENRDRIEQNLLDTNSPINERFISEYDLAAQNSESNDIKAYHEIYNTSFPADFLRTEPLSMKNIEQKIKQKYYSNPVYKTLLYLDIDLFLKRQPKDFQLSSDQEFDLYTKRRMLESYYDSLRYYANLPYAENFDTFFDGAKSFSSKVYNQQFKGTLRSVRRLFSLTLTGDSEINKPVQKILKFDQPVYNISEKQRFSPYHEELIFQSNEADKPFPNTQKFFTKPLYAGWDEHMRKFVITNKLLPRNWAGYKVTLESGTRNKFYSEDLKQNHNQKIKFTTWPLAKDKVEGSKKQSNIPYITLFDFMDDRTKESLGSDFSSLPANVERYQRLQLERGENQQAEEQFSSLAPKRGGFIWPGNTKVNFTSFLTNSN